MKKFITILIVIFAVGQIVFAQTQKFDVMTFTPPKGWTLQKNDNAKVYSTMDKSTNKFCLIMLYPSIQSNGNADDDFKYVWKQLVQDAFKTSGNPEKETAELDGFTMIQGGELITYEGSQALAMVTILSGKGRVISLLSIMSDAGYTNDIQAFLEGMDVDIKETRIETPSVESEDSGSKPTSIIGEWSDTGAVLASYVNGSGQYVGDASSATSTAYKFQANGKYDSFFANTKAFKTDTYLYRGTYKVSGNTITLIPTFYERRTNTKIQPNNDPNNMKKLTFSYSFEKNTDRNIWGIRFEGDDDNFVGNGLLYRAK